MSTVKAILFLLLAQFQGYAPFIKPNAKVAPSKPSFEALKKKGTDHLLKNGFSVFSEEENRKFFVNGSKIYIAIISQGYDMPEVWIGKKPDEEWIRIGYLLEIYLTGKTRITKKHVKKGTMYDEEKCFDYYADFLGSYYNKIVEILPFPEVYNDWRLSNSAALLKASKKLRKKSRRRP